MAVLTPARPSAAQPGSLPDIGPVLPVTTVLMVTAWLSLVPLPFLLWGSVSDAPPGSVGSFTLDNYVRAYTAGSTWRTILNTVWFSLGSAMFGMVLGTIFAWLAERTNMPGRHLAFVLTLVPLMLPGVLEAIAWQLLLSPRSGWINVQLRNWLGLGPIDIYSIGGMIWVQGLGLTPLIFILLTSAFRSMDPALEEAALMGGSGQLSTLRRVTLPLMAPALSAAFLMSVIRSAESFELPAFLGVRAGIFVFTTDIFLAVRRIPPNVGYGTALCVTFLVLSIAGVLLYQRIIRGAERYSTVTGKGFRPRPIDLRGYRWLALALFAAYLITTVGLPLFIMVWGSLLPFYQVPDFAQVAQMSLDNYRKVWEYPRAVQSVTNSIVLAVGAATGTMLLTSIIAWVVLRTRLPGRQLVDLVAFLPFALPGVVLGVSLMWTYAFLPLPVYGTMLMLLIAYMTRSMPYGVRSMMASMIQVHRELEEAAALSGAGWGRTFARITFPLLRAGLAGGWLYIFILSLKELTMSLLLYSQGNEVLSIIIWNLWESAKPELVAALGVMMVAVLAALVLLVRRVVAAANE
jgi:iron(III) transport system permease protein